MRVLVCGKGGCGKSTISVLMAKAMKKRGFTVLLVDADESNFGLHRLLGIDLPVQLMENLGGKKEFKQKISQKNKGFVHNPSGSIFQGKWRMIDIPEACVCDVDDIRLLVIGKIHDFGEGCACPMGVLSKMFLDNLELGDKEIVVVDTEAGVEHFGRRLDAECDMVFAIVDPTYESFMLAGKIAEMAESAGTDCYYILNKVEDRLLPTMERYIDKERIVARIPNNDTIFFKSFEGDALDIEIPEMDAVCDVIIEKQGGHTS